MGTSAGCVSRNQSPVSVTIKRTFLMFRFTVWYLERKTQLGKWGNFFPSISDQWERSAVPPAAQTAQYLKREHQVCRLLFLRRESDELVVNKGNL